MAYFKSFLIFLLTYLLSFPVSADPLFYRVKEADQLGKVAVKLKFEGIYKKKGPLELICKENNIKPFGDRIYPGQKIFFPSQYENHLRNHAIVLDTKEVQFKEPRFIASEGKAETKEEPKKVLVTKPSSRRIVKKAPEKDKASFEIKVSEGFYRLDGADKISSTKGSLLSELSPSVELSTSFHWNPIFSTTVGFSQTFLSFQSLKQSSKAIENQNINLGEIYLRNQFQVNDRVLLGVVLSMEEALIYKATSLTSVKLLKAPVSSVSVEAGINLWKYEGYAIDAQGFYGILGSDEVEGITLDGGTKMGLGLQGSYKVKSFEVSGGLAFEEKTINTPSVNYSLEGIKATIGIGVGF